VLALRALLRVSERGRARRRARARPDAQARAMSILAIIGAIAVGFALCGLILFKILLACESE
jgi:hypothetical protein